jgi:hypothetical protein
MFPTNYPSLKKFQAARTKALSIPHSKIAARDDETSFLGSVLNTEDRWGIVAPRYVAAFKAWIAHPIGSTGGADKDLIQIHCTRGVAVSRIKAQVNARLTTNFEDRRRDLSPRRSCCNLG